MLRTALRLLACLALLHTAAVASGDEARPAEPRDVVLIGDSNTWYYNRPMSAHKVMELMLEGIPFLHKEWRGARVHNLAISATRPHDWIVEKKCIAGQKGERYPINSHCDEIDFLAEGITKVVPSPDVVIVNLGLNAAGRETPEEAADQLVELKKYLEGITPRVIMAAPVPLPEGHHRQKFVEALRQEMIDRDLLDWDFPLMEYQDNNTNVHLTERARARHGALMAIWLVYGAPSYEVGVPRKTR